MEAVPLHLREANEFVAKFHRHNLPTVGGKFAVGAAVDGKLVGVAIAGRPVARRLDDGKTLEILRVATDGTPNANSFLYGRVKRIAQLMGYTKILTYTLERRAGLATGGWGEADRPARVARVGQPQPPPQEPERLPQAEISLGIVNRRVTCGTNKEWLYLKQNDPDGWQAAAMLDHALRRMASWLTTICTCTAVACCWTR